MIPLVPAIIPTSAKELQTLLPRLSFSSEIHIDVVDGVFVPSISWPYEPSGVPTAVKSFTDPFTLEVDLMVIDSVNAAATWIDAGADMLVFHVEGVTLEAFRKFVAQAPATVSVGIAALNDTPLSVLLPYLEFADSVQLMGIAQIGSQGQPFDERVLGRIATIKKEFPYHPITVDGSVNETTIQRIVAAGADRCICGSAITKALDPVLAAEKLRALIN